MEFLKCKACGSFGMVPMDVRLVDKDDEVDDDQGLGDTDLPEYLAEHQHEDNEESRFYSCHVCGDNWLSIRRRADEGSAKLTFIHQMGVEPVLRRVAHLQTDIVVNDRTVDQWVYFLDEDEVGEGEWMDKLADRRKVLKAICSN